MGKIGEVRLREEPWGVAEKIKREEEDNGCNSDDNSSIGYSVGIAEHPAGSWFIAVRG